MTRRRWIADHWDDATATLTGTQADHLVRVLRARPGMEADIVAGGRVFHSELAAIEDVSGDQLSAGGAVARFRLLAEVEAEPALPITLVMSIFKFDRMEWAIEKATELGVAAIVPVIARRTDKHLMQASDKRAERWRRIAHEASQQARRSDVPQIFDPIALLDRVKTPRAGTRIVLAEQERSTTLREAIEEALGVVADQLPALEIAVGPEGGWVPEEVALFDANQWRAVSLGPRILRAETAAIAALALTAALVRPGS